MAPYLVLIILSAGIVASIRWKKLTVPAALTGGVLGWLIYAGAGLTGLSMLAAFFIMGTAATSWKKKEKRLIKTNDSQQVTRKASQVIANGGVAALTGLGILLFPAYRPLLQIAMAGSLASATADTLSSELGMVTGRRFYHILSFKPDQKGRDGVVSIEGLLIGLAGSAIIGGLYLLGGHLLGDHYTPGYEQNSLGNGRGSAFWIIVLAGTVGNLVDSVLGATLERRGMIGNDTVNFLNTLAAALVAGVLAA